MSTSTALPAPLEGSGTTRPEPSYAAAMNLLAKEGTVNQDDRLITTMLVNNIHCASCVLHIQGILKNFNPVLREVAVSVVTHEVRVVHPSFIETSSLCQVLADAAFGLYSASSVNGHGDTVTQIDFQQHDDGWFEAASDIWRHPQQTSCLPLPTRNKRKRHVENCAACQEQEKPSFEPHSRRVGAQPGNEKDFLSKEKLLGDYSQFQPNAQEAQIEKQQNALARSSSSSTLDQDSSFNGRHLQQSPGADSSLNENATPDYPTTCTQPSDSSIYDVTMSIEGMTCVSCTNAITKALQDLAFVKVANVDLMTNSAQVRIMGPDTLVKTLIKTIEDIGYEASVTDCNLLNVTGTKSKTSNPSRKKYKAILAIGGMTCASCTNAVTDVLNGLPFVESVSVNLLANSGTVIFEGEERLNEILEKIEDMGYEPTLERRTTIDSSGSEESQATVVSTRSISLRVDGMFCEHCPPQVLASIKGKYPDKIIVDKPPSFKDPILRITYQPQAPQFTIRDIIAAINSTNNDFVTSIDHPASIEERSILIQINERKRIFRRLLLCLVVIVPTFLISVVWTSLVPSANPLRIFFDTKVIKGNVPRSEWALLFLATPVYFFAADVFHVRAIKEIRALWRRGSRVPILRRFCRFGSMNLLISAGTSIAYFSSLALLIIGAISSQGTGTSTYFDSVVFLTFFILIGKYLEAYSKSKTGDAISMLGNLRPAEAILLESTKPGSSESHGEKVNNVGSGTSTQTINAEMLEVGDTVIIPRGSSPPADGIILSGQAQFDESSLTGESRSVRKGPGDKVFVGTINVGNSITVEITETGGSSMLDQIVAVVREGRTKRAPVERIADLLTGYFVPVITALAIMTFFVWFALGQSGYLSPRYLNNQAGGWTFWSLEFAIAVFVVACPCGIGLAAPTALFVGGGLAAKHGILVRGGGEAFQKAEDLDAIVFDKTGTLTEGGDLQVTDHEVFAEDIDSKIIWSIIKALEEQSSHPIARAIVRLASGQSSTQVEVDSITEEAGLGIRGTFTSHGSTDTNSTTYEATLGSENLISQLSPSPPEQTYFISQSLSTWKSQSKSIALLAIRKISTTTTNNNSSSWRISALFATSDPLRPSAHPTIRNLLTRGISVYMLTGDNPSTAASVASSLGIPIANVFAGVLPTEKANKIRWLQDHGPRRNGNDSKKNGSKAKVAFIGDGINDAPALATATLSISLSTGSPIALSSSSFILLSPSLMTIPVLLDLSTRVFRRIKFNFAWALVYNIFLVPIAAGILFRVREDGWRLGPVWGSAAMAGSSVSVVCSSLLLRWEGTWLDAFRGLMFWSQKGGNVEQESEEVNVGGEGLKLGDGEVKSE
ncbi:MAG: hypothetical protein MMC33_000565 [Icmadophila ericetorum]|nr:hypothetical protein [Icmadophila ericetorum]